MWLLFLFAPLSCVGFEFYHLADLHVEPFYDASQLDNRVCRRADCITDEESLSCPMWAPVEGCSFENNVEYVGKDLSDISTGSAALCCDACFVDPSCVVFSWRQSDGRCFLKYGRSIGTPTTGHTSGPAVPLTGDFNIYGRPGCDPPMGLLDSMVYSMKGRNPDPDFILISGDIPSHQLSDPLVDLSQKGILHVVEKAFPTTDVIFSLGNNDLAPKNRNDAAQFERVWTHLSNHATFGSEEEERYKAGGYTVWKGTEAQTPWVLLLNTCLNVAKCFDDGIREAQWDDVAGQQMDFVTSVLSEARAAGKKVVISGHWPPGRWQGEDEWFTSDQEEYISLVSSYSDTVMLQLFGHHSTELIRAYSNDFALLGATGFAPRTATRPTYQAVSHNGNTPLEVVTYSLDLLEASLATENVYDEWGILFSLAEDYGVPDVSPASLFQVTQQIVGSSAAAARYLTYQLRAQGDAFYNTGDVFVQMICETVSPDEATELACIASQAAAMSEKSSPQSNAAPSSTGESWVPLLAGLGGVVLVAVAIAIAVLMLRARQPKGTALLGEADRLVSITETSGRW